jgi:hypothetical protein
MGGEGRVNGDKGLLKISESGYGSKKMASYDGTADLVL